MNYSEIHTFAANSPLTLQSSWNMLRFAAIISLHVTTVLSMAAQDLHYSQFYNNPMHLSPSATGIFKGDLRAAALYRSQWRSVPVAYETYAGSVEWKALQRARNAFSIGLQLQNDKAGDAGLSWLQIGANIGAVQALNQNHALSVGFGLALAQRSFGIGGLTFKNQWGGDVFDPGRPTGESFAQASNLVPTMSAGLQYHFEQSETRSRIDLGGGAAHLNKPLVNLGDFAKPLPFRISCFANAYWQIQTRLDLVFLNEYQQMGSAKELVFGAGIRQILTTGLANETSLQFTLAHRLGDAIIPAVQVDRNNWTLGLSYDWNSSAFDTATRGRGGIEIAVIWRRIPVPALTTVKSCPVF